MTMQPDLVERYAALADKYEKLRGEVERLTEEVNALRLVATAHDAEVERLKEELHYAYGTSNLAMKHRDVAEAEVERLREALETIQRDAPEVIRAYARRALEPKP